MSSNYGTGRSDRDPHSLLVGRQNGTAVWKAVWQFDTMLSIYTIWLSRGIPKDLPKSFENLCPHQTDRQMFMEVLFALRKTENNSGAL